MSKKRRLTKLRNRAVRVEKSVEEAVYDEDRGKLIRERDGKIHAAVKEYQEREKEARNELAAEKKKIREEFEESEKRLLTKHFGKKKSGAKKVAA